MAKANKVKTILRKSPVNNGIDNAKTPKNERIQSMAKKTIRKPAAINDSIVKKPVNSKSETIFDVYAEKMQKNRSLKKGIVTSGKYHVGQECIAQEQFQEQDVLQDAMLKLLETAEKETIEKPEHLINKACKQARIDIYKKALKGSQFDENGDVKRFIEFNSQISEIKQDYMIDNNEKALMIETIRHIGKNLKSNLHKRLFSLYFLKGLTIRQIESRLNLDKSSVNRELKKITNKIHALKITELYEIKFASPGYTAAAKALYPIAKAPKSDKNLQWEKPAGIDIKTYIPAGKKPFSLVSIPKDIEFAEKGQKARKIRMSKSIKTFSFIKSFPDYNRITLQYTGFYTLKRKVPDEKSLTWDIINKKIIHADSMRKEKEFKAIVLAMLLEINIPLAWLAMFDHEINKRFIN